MRKEEIPEGIINLVCNRFGYDVEDVSRQRKRRKREDVIVRFTIFYLLREFTTLSYKSISEITNTEKHHATILHGCRQIRDQIELYRDGRYNDLLVRTSSDLFDYLKDGGFGRDNGPFGLKCQIKNNSEIGVVTRLKGSKIRVSYPSHDVWTDRESISIIK